MARLTRLDVTDLTLARGPRTLFRELSFSVEAGQAVVLVGENGAGKTSLLRSIAGLLQPSGGTIRFLSDEADVDTHEAIRTQCHLVGHLDGLAGARPVRDELRFWAVWTGGSIDIALDAADRLGLARLLDLPVRKLSAGQRRRVALIRLVASSRALWLLDEPTTALDAASRAWIGTAMGAHLDAGGLIVAAAHDPLPILARTVEVGR